MKEILESVIRGHLQTYAAQNQIEIPSRFEFDLSLSKDLSHGDFASNVAFKLSALVKKPPRKVAEELISLAQKCQSQAVERMEVGGGGFINFYLTKTSLNDILKIVCRDPDRYGHSDYGKGKKSLVEFVSANPTGPLTIAHGRQAVIGAALVQILKAAGFNADAEYYLNDAGRQMNLLGESLWARYQQELGLSAEIPKDGYQGAYLIDIAKQLVQSKQRGLLNDPNAVEICREFAKDEIMQGIRQDLQDIGISFDHYFSEQTLYKNGEVEQTFVDLQARGYLYDQDGALWFKSTAFGDDKDRVVRKSSGELTYLAPDIAYHRYKFKRGYNRLVNLLGPDHHGYVARLKAACSALGHDPKDIEIKIVQLTSLYRKGEPVRMSTRAGEFVTLKELRDEVGSDATRFFFIMRKIESHLDFDLDLATEKSQDNPVYYLQYAHARICSIIRNVTHAMNFDAKIERLTTEEETTIIKAITAFPQIIIDAAEQLEPYRIADYLRELAANFHKFYAHHRVLTEDTELTDARLLLIEATRIVLKNGLGILGISHPESM